MPNRDYAARTKSKKGGSTLLIFIIILLLLLLSILGLWLLNSYPSAPTPVTAPVKPTAAEVQQKNSLPSRPEEIYSYIRDLETREVPIDKNSKLVQLTREQEQQILQRQAEEKQRLEQAQQAQVTQTTTPDQSSPSDTNTPPSTEEPVVKKELEKKQTQAKKPATEAPKSIGKYGLQCGAFKSKAQAENMQARLAMAGYNAKISSNAEWNRVFVGPIGDRAAASAAQSNARSVAECLIVGM